MYSIVFFLMSLHALIAVDPQYLSYRLDENMVTKVSDFGVTHDVYVNDYYKLHHSALLPVKWLAPEALLDRVFTMKTDIVGGLHTKCNQILENRSESHM